MGAQDDASEALHQEIRARLRSVGQVYTAGRRRIVEVLSAAARPRTIPELIDAHPRIASSSAYRNVAVFEQVGIVERIHTGGEHARFELSEEVMGHHHHHLICESCGRIDDFTVPDPVEAVIDRALQDAAAASGFVASAHRLDLVGTCGACAAT